jgi:hypothetical protein
MGKCMSDAGFVDVRTMTQVGFYAGETREEALEKFLGLWWMIKSDWTEEEKGRFEEDAKRRNGEAAVECTMPDGRPGYGYAIGFVVVIARKGEDA